MKKILLAMVLGVALIGTHAHAETFDNLTVTGKAGIGTSNPIYKLDVRGAGSQIGGNLYGILQLSDASMCRGGYWGYDNSIPYSLAIAPESGPVEFWTYDGSIWGERVRINETGNVGIGTTNPQSKLDIQSGGTTCWANLGGPTNTVYSGFSLTANTDTAQIWKQGSEFSLYGGPGR